MTSTFSKYTASSWKVSWRPMSFNLRPLLLLVCLLPIVKLSAPGSWLAFIRKLARGRLRQKIEPNGSSSLLSGDSAASDRIAPAGSRHPPHRTGRAPFKASGSPSDGLDQSREHQPSAIVVGCIHPFSGVVRSVPHPSDCPPSPCGRLSRPRTTTRALPHVRHWPQAGLPRCRGAEHGSQVHVGCVCVSW